MAGDITRRVRVVHRESGKVLAVAEVADDPWNRMVGLLGRASLPREGGLVLDPCRAIHTWFMRFAIDVLFLDARGHVVRAMEHVGPFRMASGGLRARVVVELPSGTLGDAGVTTGANVTMEPA